VSKLTEPGGEHIAASGFKVVIGAVASVVPTFLVMAVRVRGEHHTARFQGCVQFPQHARQLLAGYMKQRGVGEHAIKMVIRQIELEEILPPHFAAAVGARHRGEAWGPFQADREVAEFDEHLEVAPWPTTKIKYRERRFTLDVSDRRVVWEKISNSKTFQVCWAV
jgi:hypothetical protein